MKIQHLISSYTRYNLWANETLCSWLKGHGNSLLYQQTPSSYPTIDRTLQHMIHAQNYWLAVITKSDLSKLDETIKDNMVDVVIDELNAGAQKMVEVYSNYTEEELSERVKTTDMIQSRAFLIMHAINHNSYHRGQIITMCRILGLTKNIPSTDFDVFLWTEFKS